MKNTFSQKPNKKYHSKTQRDEKKNLSFHDIFYHLLFLISPGHNRWRWTYLIKNDSSEGL